MYRAVLFLTVIVFLFVSCTDKPDIVQPNVLILLADDLGSTDLACYGGKARSPHLDQLAENGIRFTNFYSPAPNCSPSRAGLLTGRMPSRVGMYNYRRDLQTMHLPDSELTIAELLKEKGYQTAHFGKWHLSCLPQDKNLNQPQPADQGFDYSLGTENNAAPSHLNPHNFVRNGVRVGETEGYSCQLVVDEAIEWLRKYYVHENPFFMYVAFHEVHTKVASPGDMIEHYPDESPRYAEYLANVENMDNASGRLLAELENRGLLENTIVLFASDNGPYRSGSAGELRGLKGEVYEGGIRVPGIISFPPLIDAGRTCNTPAGLVDVLPTLASICGFTVPDGVVVDGTDITPLLQNESFQRNKPLMWFFYRSWPEVSLRMGDFVLIGNALDSIPRTHPISDLDMDFIKTIELKEFELYNIKQDPSQSVNLVAEHPEILNEMKPVMIELLEEIKRDGPYWEGMLEYESLPSKMKKGYIR